MKKGKRYGPYLYESYRDSNGNVKKRYLGKYVEKKNSFKTFFLLVFGFFLFIGMSFLVFSQTSPHFNSQDTFFGADEFFASYFSDFSGVLTGYSVDDPDLEEEPVDVGETEEPVDEDEEGPVEPEPEEEVVEAEPGEELVEEDLDEDNAENESEGHVEAEPGELAEDDLENGSESSGEEPLEIESGNETGLGKESNETFDSGDLDNETLTGQGENDSFLEDSLDNSLINETSFEIGEVILNETINETSGNISLINETLIGNVTNESIPKAIFENASTTLQYKAVIGRPVKWVKTVDLDIAENVTVEIPLESMNISVLTGEEVGGVIEDLDSDKLAVEEFDREKISAGVLTGFVSYDLDLEGRGFLIVFWNWLLDRLTISGNVIADKEVEELIMESEDSLIIDLNNVSVTTNDLAVEYYTPAPEAVEINVANGKRVIVFADDSLNYTDVLAYSDLSDRKISVDDSRLKLYWYSDNFEDSVSIDSRVETLLGQKVALGVRSSQEFVKYDFDNDGFVDYVEWVVPHLSAQTYEIVIEIVAAEHLDYNRTFISDIFRETYQLDDIWSEPIYSEEYVRATFEKPLESWNDITVFSKTNSGTGNMTIEVYLENGTDVIAVFPYLNESDYTKVLLTGMNGSHDTFDLKIISLDNEINSSLIFDHITDPSGSPGKVHINFEFDTTLDDGAYTPHDFLEVTVNVTDNETDNNLSSVLNYDNSIIDIVRFENDPNGTLGSLKGFVTGGSIGGDGRFGETFTGTGTSGDGVNLSENLRLDINPNDEFTVSAWIKRAATGHGYIVSEPNTAQRAFDFFIQNNILKFRVYSGGTTIETLSQEGTITDTTEWHHVVARYNGTDIFIYIDGALNSSVAATGVKSGVYSDVYIGRTKADATIPWNGDIDDVIFFNRSISDEEIVMLFNGSNMTVNFTGLVEGTHTLKAYGQNTFGDFNETSIRTVGVDLDNPTANYTFNATIGGVVSTIKDNFAVAHGVDVYEESDNPLFFSGHDNFSNVSSFIDINGDILEWFRMDDNNGTHIHGHFGNLNGTISGGNLIPSGRFGQGIYFVHGGDDGVDVDDGRINPNGNFSVSLWFKNAYADVPAGGNGNLFDRKTSTAGHNSNVFKVTVTPAEAVVATFYNGVFTIAEKPQTGAGSVGDTEWHHVVVTYNIDDSRNASIYLDGVLKETLLLSAPVGTTSGQINIGKNPGDSNEFNGTMDDVIIFTRHLTPGEVTALYSASKQVNTTRYLDYFTNDLHNYTIYAQDFAGNLNSTNESLLHNASLVMGCRDFGYTGRTYWLVENISTDGNCSAFTANSTTLDLNGTNLYGSGAGSYGLLGSRGLENTTIHGGTVVGFDRGFYNFMNSTTITNVSFISPISYSLDFQENKFSYLNDINVSSSSAGGINYYLAQGHYMDVFNISVDGASPVTVGSSWNNTFANGDIEKYAQILRPAIFLTGVDNESSFNVFTNITIRGSLGLGVSDSSSFDTYSRENEYLGNEFIDSFATDFYFSKSLPSDYNFTGNSIEYVNEFAGVLFYNESIVASGTNLSATIIPLENTLFVDTSKDTSFNGSAKVTLFGHSFNETSMYPLVDFDDDGVYEVCTDGGGICTNISSTGGNFIFNVSHFTTYSADDDVAPNDPVVSINFSDVNNWTNETIFCNGETIIDQDSSFVNVSVDWFVNGEFNQTIDYLNQSNGSAFSAPLTSGNTTKLQNWSCQLQYYAKNGIASAHVNSSENASVLDFLTIVTQSHLLNNSATTDRTPFLNWTYEDIDGDVPPGYDLFITEYQFSGGFSCSDSQTLSSLTTASTTLSTDLACLHDNGYQYHWQVKVNDSSGAGYSDIFAFNVTGVINMALTTSEINFTSIDVGVSNDTTDDNPPPFVLENNGTVIINVSVNSTSLWTSVTANSSFYQFKVDNTSEVGSFDFPGSITSLYDMPINSVVGMISLLKYSDSTDTAEIDISIDTPTDEEDGVKEADLIFTGVLAE